MRPRTATSTPGRLRYRERDGDGPSLCSFSSWTTPYGVETSPIVFDQPVVSPVSKPSLKTLSTR